MTRAAILVIDSLGIGATPDAEAFGETDADTLGHIADAGALNCPNLARLGLGEAARIASGRVPAGLEFDGKPEAIFAACAEQSRGKDTPSGHWEMAGLPVLFDWGYFDHAFPSFPEELTAALIEKTGVPGLLGNKHASGTEIINELGDEHVATGQPIVYTSADSVFQIAAHEKYFGLDRLLAVCDIARELVDPYNIGRVIARPFVGENGEYTRTANRRDLATPPPGETLLDVLASDDRAVTSIGKIGDIFAHRNVGQVVKAAGTGAQFDATLKAFEETPDGGFIFTNFVDFDMMFGHRRDVDGYRAELDYFDSRLPELEAALQLGDMVVLTADHGCDPTWPGSDHTRECVPLIAFGPSIESKNGGLRDSFADIGQTVAEHLGISALKAGRSAL